MEVEIKLRLSTERAEYWARTMQQQDGEPSELRAVYFDTDDARLAAAGLSLRVRREGGRWIQTVKAGGDAAIGRLEEEVELTGEGADVPRPDPAKHAGAAGKLLAETLARSPAPPTARFETAITRRSRRVTTASGTEAEFALDIGYVRAGDRRCEVAEIEIEHLAGPIGGLFDIAADVLDTGGAWLAVTAKAERGDRLARGHQPGATKSLPVELSPRCGGHELVAAVLRNTMAQVLRNAEALADGSRDADTVHQLRVGLRRTRTALRELKDIAPGAGDSIDEPLAETFAVLGGRRDDEVVAAAVRPYLEAAGAPRLAWTPKDSADLQAAVRAGGFQAALLRTLRLAYEPEAAGEAVPYKRLEKLLSRRLEKLHTRIVREGWRFDELSTEDQHRVRKRLKRLRYLSEFIGGLWKAADVDAYLARLKPAQDALGTHNDTVVAGERFRADAREHPDSWFAAGLLHERLHETARGARKSLRRVARAKRFWRR